MGFRGVVFSVLGMEICVKSIISTDVFNRFQFFDLFVNFEFPRLDFSCFWCPEDTFG